MFSLWQSLSLSNKCGFPRDSDPILYWEKHFPGHSEMFASHFWVYASVTRLQEKKKPSFNNILGIFATKAKSVQMQVVTSHFLWLLPWTWWGIYLTVAQWSSHSLWGVINRSHLLICHCFLPMGCGWQHSGCRAGSVIPLNPSSAHMSVSNHSKPQLQGPVGDLENKLVVTSGEKGWGRSQTEVGE